MLALLAAGCGMGLSPAVLVDTPGLRIVRLTVANANVYLVEQGDARLMIDAGNPGDGETYVAQMREFGIDPATIGTVLLTHGHVDHAGTAAWFRERYGADLVAGAGDRPMLARGGADPGICTTGLLARLIRWSRSGMRYPPFEVDRSLDGAFDLAAWGIEGQVIPSPGHTPGSIVVVIGEHAFVGDLIRGGLLDPTSPETHFFQCDLAENRTRIAEVLARREVRVWHPGHFGPLDADAVRDYLAGAD